MTEPGNDPEFGREFWDNVAERAERIMNMPAHRDTPLEREKFLVMIWPPWYMPYVQNLVIRLYRVSEHLAGFDDPDVAPPGGAQADWPLPSRVFDWLGDRADDVHQRLLTHEARRRLAHKRSGGNPMRVR